MRRVADLLATVDRWKGDDGQERKRRIVIGAMFRDTSSGAVSIRLDVAPISPHWAGWISVERVGRDDTGSAP